MNGDLFTDGENATRAFFMKGLSSLSKLSMVSPKAHLAITSTVKVLNTLLIRIRIIVSWRLHWLHTWFLELLFRVEFALNSSQSDYFVGQFVGAFLNQQRHLYNGTFNICLDQQSQIQTNFFYFSSCERWADCRAHLLPLFLADQTYDFSEIFGADVKSLSFVYQMIKLLNFSAWY